MERHRRRSAGEPSARLLGSAVFLEEAAMALEQGESDGDA
jgi:hypothetical protein